MKHSICAIGLMMAWGPPAGRVAPTLSMLLPIGPSLMR
jgi:hypothetical protein